MATDLEARAVGALELPALADSDEPPVCTNASCAPALGTERKAGVDCLTQIPSIPMPRSLHSFWSVLHSILRLNELSLLRTGGEVGVDLGAAPTGFAGQH